MMIMTGLLGIHIPKTKTLRAVLLLAVALSAGSLSAQGRVFWQEGGVAVCGSTWGVNQAASSDDSGGILLVWADSREEPGSVWAQRVDREGRPIWQADGVRLRAGVSSPRQFTVVPDGSGGLLAVWEEASSTAPHSRITAQRVDASGAVRWGPSGVIVAGSNVPQNYQVSAVSDCGSGLLVAWIMATLDSSAVDTLCAQRFDSIGNPQWSSPFVVVATDTLYYSPPQVCSDGLGGVCVVWAVWRGPEYRVFAQHLDSTGCLSWPGGGTEVVSGSFVAADVTPFAAGYGVVCRMGDRIRAQRLDASGQRGWGPDGRSVYAGTGILGSAVRILPEAESALYAVWSEKRADVYDIYAQLLDSNGCRLWDSLGVQVGSINYTQSRGFGAVCDGRDGLIASWPTYVGGVNRWDIYAQRLNSAGQLLWGPPGLGVATDSGTESWEPCVVTDARQGAIVAWGYTYSGQRGGLNVQRVGDATGLENRSRSPLPRLAIRTCPSPARRSVELILPRASAMVVIADALGRTIRELPVVRAGGTLVWDLTDSKGLSVPTGVYYLRQRGRGLSPVKVVVVKP